MLTFMDTAAINSLPPETKAKIEYILEDALIQCAVCAREKWLPEFTRRGRLAEGEPVCDSCWTSVDWPPYWL